MELQKKEEVKKDYQEPTEGDFKMPVFTFGGIGANSFSTMGSLKNVKSPIFLKSKPS
jgi:hypothetical protein